MIYKIYKKAMFGTSNWDGCCLRFSYEAVLYLAAEARMDQVNITVKSSRATDSPTLLTDRKGVQLIQFSSDSDVIVRNPPTQIRAPSGPTGTPVRVKCGEGLIVKNRTCSKTLGIATRAQSLLSSPSHAVIGLIITPPPPRSLRNACLR